MEILMNAAYRDRWDNIGEILGVSKFPHEILELLDSVGLQLVDFKNEYTE